MDKIDKALAKLSPKERAALKKILLQLRSGSTRGLQPVKLKGYANIYRIRKGPIRIIFRSNAQEFTILAVLRRSERTYKDL